MKDSEYVMYLWHETELRRKEMENRKKMIQKQKSDVDSEEKKGGDQRGSVEKTMIDKEPTKEDARISPQQIDVVQSPSKEKQEKLTDEDVETSAQQNDVPQDKRQKIE
ncbi:uncharacterized protein LOC125864772 [Solanum stenotomum]|uniref:uncharacterized protein LOC125864772 n=1 Tax=Solanum stenotomum TaxID=172797 RepID=UPI0020D03CAD|nr:uncharacterized protein LOC125864772 [Solanum stenotomum]